jgi:hypothetical protein
MALAYATGVFFERLMARLPASTTLLIYTSDHGQDFAQRAPHRNPVPRDSEYSVRCWRSPARRRPNDSSTNARCATAPRT